MYILKLLDTDDMEDLWMYVGSLLKIEQLPKLKILDKQLRLWTLSMKPENDIKLWYQCYQVQKHASRRRCCHASDITLSASYIIWSKKYTDENFTIVFTSYKIFWKSYHNEKSRQRYFIGSMLPRAFQSTIK